MTAFCIFGVDGLELEVIGRGPKERAGAFYRCGLHTCAMVGLLLFLDLRSTSWLLAPTLRTDTPGNGLFGVYFTSRWDSHPSLQRIYCTKYIATNPDEEALMYGVTLLPGILSWLEEP
jgi:hypothetical protein